LLLLQHMELACLEKPPCWKGKAWDGIWSRNFCPIIFFRRVADPHHFSAEPGSSFSLQCDLVSDPAPDQSYANLRPLVYSGRGKFMPLPLKSKILETPGSLATDDIKMFLL
jgi:hypothetical protein